MSAWLTAFACGLGAGIVSAWGVGGGTLLLVLLTLVLHVEQRTAQGINLLFFLPTARRGAAFPCPGRPPGPPHPCGLPFRQRQRQPWPAPGSPLESMSPCCAGPSAFICCSPASAFCCHESQKSRDGAFRHGFSYDSTASVSSNVTSMRSPPASAPWSEYRQDRDICAPAADPDCYGSARRRRRGYNLPPGFRPRSAAEPGFTYSTSSPVSPSFSGTPVWRTVTPNSGSGSTSP